MGLIAYRSEYQLSVDTDKNRIFYKPYSPLNKASALPDYLADWTQALAQVRPGFTVLTDVTHLTVVNPDLNDFFTQAQRLLVKAGVRQVAEVHGTAETEALSAAVVQETGMPCRRFLDLWEADKYLDALESRAPVVSPGGQQAG